MKDKKPTYRIEAVLQFDAVDADLLDGQATEAESSVDLPHELTVETIVDVVAHKFGVSAEEIKTNKQSKSAQETRYAVVYLATRLVHAARMNKERAKDPEHFASYGWVPMRVFIKQINDELAEALKKDHTTIMYYDEQAALLRKENEEFRKKTDDIWAEIDDAYELDTNHSHVIWRDQIEEQMAQETSQDQPFE